MKIHDVSVMTQDQFEDELDRIEVAICKHPLCKKRDEAWDRITNYSCRMASLWNTRNYNAHIERARKTLNKIHEVMYTDIGIDRRYITL
jgi:hypothetical protein